MELLDRYRTTAARAYSRSLNDLYKLKKQKTNEDRWRQHFELQKRRFDLDLERFNLTKEKAMRKQAPLPAEPEPEIDWEKELDELLPIPVAAKPPQPAGASPAVGAVPAEYQHLITPDAVSWGKSTSVQKIYSFAEWQKLA